MLEVERKFLVKTIPDISGIECIKIKQGYLLDCHTKNGIEKRFREENEKCYFTIKTIIPEDKMGISRDETTVELTRESFEMYWPKTEGRRVEKKRYKIPYGEFVIELDIYNGQHTGLVVAEVEFKDVNQAFAFIPPNWFGEDVSNDKRYSNQNLACNGLPTQNSTN